MTQKRARPDVRERIPTEPTAHFDRNERHVISGTGHEENSLEAPTR
jgi:hypothetical protein